MVQSFAVDYVHCVRSDLASNLVTFQEVNSISSSISFMLKDCKPVSKSWFVQPTDDLHALDDRYESKRTSYAPAEQMRLHAQI